MTENEDKHLKNNLPPGVPAFEKWQLASRNHKILQQNRISVFKKSNIKDPGNQRSSVFNFVLEIQSVRKVVRESKLLVDPQKESPLQSIDGIKLHPSLVNFFFTASENYSLYITEKESDLKPVFVTYGDEIEYNDINNWTIRQIDRKQLSTLQKLLTVDKHVKLSFLKL